VRLARVAKSQAQSDNATQNRRAQKRRRPADKLPIIGTFFRRRRALENIVNLILLRPLQIIRALAKRPRFASHALFLAVAFMLAAPTIAAAEEIAPTNATPAHFVGSETCTECHKAEQSDWQGSHHALAMQKADEKSVLGRFDGAAFEKDGARSVFKKRGEAFLVETAGPDGGKTVDFEVKYAFGVFPLQQYLIELPGGRLQAFGLAWDARPAAAGGQRWFDLYPDRKLAIGDPLHWTGVDQNWNYQCAWCHTTDLKKNYDLSAHSFRTQWAELGVGCEACHGPASNHLAWARKGETSLKNPPKAHGFEIALNERRGVTWPMSENGQAARSALRATSKEILVCAGCHSRREQFSDDPKSVAAYFDAFRPSLLEAPQYFEDGQQRDEVYNFASFLQSKMYASGVTCSDCHNPHSGKLRAEGNQVCAQCHSGERFDQPSHHHHAQKSAGAECANCHMPKTTYMGVHERHDHSMRIPRPDRTQALQTPNACNKCHADKSPAWALEAIKSWGGGDLRGFQTFAESFDLADRNAPGARVALAQIIENRTQSPLARASAFARLARAPTPEALEIATKALSIDDALIRMSSIAVIAAADADTRRKALVPMLNDASRLVRMDAARALAGDAESELSADQRHSFEAALNEYVEAQSFNAERAESHANLGALNTARGKVEKARAEYETALGVDPAFFPAAIALADISRSSGDEAAAESVLRKALAANSSQGALHYALGLSLIRQQRKEEGLSELATAAKQAPETADFAYVYGVALHDMGKPAQAVEVLKTALAASPNSPDILLALASYEVEQKDFMSALLHAEALAILDPDNEEAQELARALRVRVK
jgi:predicted CXXCH cytochrome family protein